LMLDNAAPDMAVIIAMQAFGGLRLQEALRLDWGDVWRVSGNVEISSAKAKTRSRRLVEINPTLAAWLKPYRKNKGAVTSLTLDAYTWQLIQLRKRLKIPSRKNRLRHGFLTAHYALNQNENQTARAGGHVARDAVPALQRFDGTKRSGGMVRRESTRNQSG